MKIWTKAAAAALILALCMAVPAVADENAEFYLVAPADSMNRELAVRLLAAPGAEVRDEMTFSTPVNRVTAAGAALVLPRTEGMWVTVDYLLDSDRDGVYELFGPEDGGPGGDSLTGGDTLVPWNGSGVPLPAEEPVSLSAAALLAGGQAYLARLGLTAEDPWGELLYMARLWQADGEESDCFYLILYENGLPTAGAADFRDVEPGSWYYSAVDYVASRGLMAGTGADTFAPDVQLTRAMLAQILYAMNGRSQEAAADFADVAAGSWYAAAANWAQARGIMQGVGGGRFAPDRLLTREQLALILYQYTGGAGREGEPLSACTDAGSVSPWAEPAVEWAVANGLLSPRSSGKLDPAGAVTRGECAAVLRRLDQLLAAED